MKRSRFSEEQIVYAGTNVSLGGNFVSRGVTNVSRSKLRHGIERSLIARQRRRKWGIGRGRTASHSDILLRANPLPVNDRPENSQRTIQLQGILGLVRERVCMSLYRSLRGIIQTWAAAG